MDHVIMEIGEYHSCIVTDAANLFLIVLEAFEEYLPSADSNSVAAVTLVATGVQPAIES